MAEVAPAVQSSHDQSATAPRLLFPADAPIPGEPVWTCRRGRTHLCCQLDVRADGLHALTLLRNSRTYGRYEFCEREAALTFAVRLRHTFQGNGWA